MLRLGTLTPSSNTVVEDVTINMLRDVPAVAPHFARFGYAGSQAQFSTDYDWQGMLGASRMLGDAKMDAICWNGSRGGSLGFERDRLLCQRIAEETGIFASTSTLALDELLRAAGIERIAFVTPYTETLNKGVAHVWSEAGYQVTGALGAGLTDNFSYSLVEAAKLREMAHQAAGSGAEALVFYCTNMRAADLCQSLEEELDLIVLDAVSAGVWKGLSMLGHQLPHGWGKLLQ